MFYLKLFKKLPYQDSKYANNPTFLSSLVSVYSFGEPSLLLLWERIENWLYMFTLNMGLYNNKKARVVEMHQSD